MARDFTDRSRKGLADDLVAGEQVEQCVLGEPEGSMLQQMSLGKRVGLAAWDAKKIRDASDPDTMAAAVSRKRHLITRTNQRVMFHQVGATAKPKKLTLAVELAEIELNAAKVKRKCHVLVKFPDDSAIVFTCPQPQPVEKIAPLLDLDL